MVMNGEAAAGLFPWGYTANAKVVDGSTEIEGFELTPVSAPVKKAGDIIRFDLIPLKQKRQMLSLLM